MKFEGCSAARLRIGFIAAGGFSAALGFVVLVGWHTHSVALIQVHPALVPMQYNTAAGFLLSGLMLLALANRLTRAAVALGSIVLAIGTLTLAQYVLGVDFGIDQLLMNHYITVQTSHPGRMAPDTALSFSLTGIAVPLSGGFMRRRGALINGTLGSLVVGLGIAAALGYVIGLESAYGWGRFTRMAVHTSAGFIVLGTGLFIFAWQTEQADRARSPRWLPIPVAVGVLTITFAMWQALHPDRNAAALQTAHALVLLFGIALAAALALAVNQAVSERASKHMLEIEIADRRQAEAALRESEDRLRRSVLDAPIPIIIHADDGEVLMISKKWTELSGYSHADIPTILDWTEKAYGADKERIRDFVVGLYEIEEPIEHEAYVTTASGEQRTWDFRTSPLGRLPDGRRFVIAMAVDITDRKRVEEALRESEERYARAVTGTNDGLWDRNLQTNEDYFSPRWEAIVGYEPGELEPVVQTFVDLLHPDDWEPMFEAVRAHLEERIAYDIEIRLRHKSGEYVWVRTRGQAVWDDDGEPSRMAGSITDITDRKAAEDKVKTALAEKEVLLKEIDHRVKNNLQVISSMLWLQAKAEKNTRTEEVLRDSYRRVMLMAKIHESLHRHDDLNVIDARDFLNTLVTDTKASSGDVSEHLSFRIDVDDISLDVDHANAYGQIISELLSNSLKHAFTDGQPGKIEISLHQVGGGVTELSVADDGKGLPGDFDLQQTKTLGLKLVGALAAKLGGSIHIDRSGGTRVQISFPEERP